MPWLPDHYAHRLRWLATGYWRPPVEPLHAVQRRVATRPGQLPCAVFWCCAFAVVGEAHCGVHVEDQFYRPSDVRGRYPRWMAREAFKRNGTTGRVGPRVLRRVRYTRAVAPGQVRRRRA